MRSTDGVTPAPAYDEFGLFHENAEEFGIPFDSPPIVSRVSVPIDAGYESARCNGDPERRRSCCFTAAPRTRTPGTRSRWPWTDRWSRSTSPGTVTRAIAKITPTGPRRTRPRSRPPCASSHPTRRWSSACRSVGSLRSRSPTARPTSFASWCSSMSRPASTARSPCDRAVHRRARVLHFLRRDPRAHRRVQPDAQ